MALREGIWRVVCSYKRREARGRNRDVTLAISRPSSPLQVIEKKKLKGVPKLTLAGPFGDGQAIGRKGKFLGDGAGYFAVVEEYGDAIGGI
jgi:hypothetical protein